MDNVLDDLGGPIEGEETEHDQGLQFSGGRSVDLVVVQPVASRDHGYKVDTVHDLDKQPEEGQDEGGWVLLRNAGHCRQHFLNNPKGEGEKHGELDPPKLQSQKKNLARSSPKRFFSRVMRNIIMNYDDIL